MATFDTSMSFTRKMHSLVLTSPQIGQSNATNMEKPSRQHSILWYHPPGWMPSVFYDSDLSKCAYSNCNVTGETGDIKSHSAIVFSERFELYPPLTPTKRPRDQIWAFFYMEPTNRMRKDVGFVSPHWRSTINMTITYRTDSDITLSYGMLRARNSLYKADYGKIFERKSKVAAWVVSNCGAMSGRDQYVRELRRHGLPIDVYGKCGDKGRISDSARINMLNNDYKFYLAFESCLCLDYITEKFFENFIHDIVIVARGGSNYSKLLPPETFIDTSNFSSPKELAKYLLAVNNSKQLYTNHLMNKNKYEALSPEFTSEYSNCRLCEKLNNIEKNRNVYEDLNSYMYNDHFSCFKPTDIIVHSLRNWLMLFAIGLGILTAVFFIMPSKQIKS